MPFFQGYSAIYREAGSSNPSLPFSARMRTAAAVKIFETEARRKTVSGATVHHYGKIVIGALSVTGTAADASSKLAVPVTIIMQQQAERTDYFTDN